MNVPRQRGDGILEDFSTRYSRNEGKGFGAKTLSGTVHGAGYGDGYMYTERGYGWDTHTRDDYWVGSGFERRSSTYSFYMIVSNE